MARQPTYKLVDSSSDIASLIPGDLVKVSLGGRADPKWMVYAGNKPNSLMGRFNCSFLEVPPAYNREFVESFMLWESEDRHLQFPGDYVVLSPLHLGARKIGLAQTEEYCSLKSLLDSIACQQKRQA